MAHLALKCQLLASHHGTTQHGSANATKAAKLDTYLDNLALSATSDHTTLQQLLDENTSLITNVTALTTSLMSLTAAYTIFASAKSPSTTTAPTALKRVSLLYPNGYCWTHG